MNLTQILTGSFLFVSCMLHAQLLSVTDGSTMRILGTSNLHDWATEVTEINGTAYFETQEDGKLEIISAQLQIPVLSIKSDKGKKMDKLTYEALENDKYANIEFELSSADISVRDGATVASINGNLTVHGVVQSITFDAVLEENNTWSGTVPLIMSEFGMDPPTALLGALKTGDDIQIEFNLTFK